MRMGMGMAGAAPPYVRLSAGRREAADVVEARGRLSSLPTEGFSSVPIQPVNSIALPLLRHHPMALRLRPSLRPSASLYYAQGMLMAALSVTRNYILMKHIAILMVML